MVAVAAAPPLLAKPGYVAPAGPLYRGRYTREAEADADASGYGYAPKCKQVPTKVVKKIISEKKAASRDFLLPGHQASLRPGPCVRPRGRGGPCLQERARHRMPDRQEDRLGQRVQGR